MIALIRQFWPEGHWFADTVKGNVTKQYEWAIRNGVNFLPESDLNRYIAEENSRTIQVSLLNPEQDVSNTEIDESYKPER